VPAIFFWCSVVFPGRAGRWQEVPDIGSTARGKNFQTTIGNSKRKQERLTEGVLELKNTLSI